MRALIIDDKAKAAVRRVRDYAEQAVHFYHPGIDHTVPGDLAVFCAHLEVGYRCVYTITTLQGAKFRHLTISVTGDKYPSIMSAYTIAELFGFSGWDGHSEKPPDGWQIAVNKKEHCVVLAFPFADRKEDLAS